jgi:hypothetical protein
MTFANVESQLAVIIQDISSFIDHLEQCVDWWGDMKAGLDGLKDTLPHITPDRTRTMSSFARGWDEVADQFSLYVYKVRYCIT